MKQYLSFHLPIISEIASFMKSRFLKKFIDLPIFYKRKHIHLKTNLKIGNKSPHPSADHHPKILLWLDDLINPMDARMDWLAFSPIGRKVKVVWVKNLMQFKNWINQNGLPDAICFDYDLGTSKPTGYDCARWLLQYCFKNNRSLPQWASQSTDPEQKAKIKRLLKKYSKDVGEN